MTENVPDPSALRQKEEHPTHGAGQKDEQKSAKDTKAQHSGKPNSANHSANNHSASSQDTVNLTVGLTPAFKRLLDAKAKKQGITISELLGNILRADIEQHEDDPPTPHASRGPWYIVLLFASFATFCSLSLADSVTGEVVRVIDPPQSAGAESGSPPLAATLNSFIHVCLLENAWGRFHKSALGLPEASGEGRLSSRSTRSSWRREREPAVRKNDPLKQRAAKPPIKHPRATNQRAGRHFLVSSSAPHTRKVAEKSRRANMAKLPIIQAPVKSKREVGRTARWSRPSSGGITDGWGPRPSSF